MIQQLFSWSFIPGKWKLCTSPYGLQGDQTSQPQKKSTLNTRWENWCWSCNTLTTWYESRLTGKDPDAGKDWRQKDKGPAEAEMVR